MSKIFLDCGTNLGQGLKHIYKLENMDDTWKIYSFEPNPNSFKIAKENMNYNNVTIINKGIWIDECKLPMTLDYHPKCSDQDSLSKHMVNAPFEGYVGGGSNIMGSNYKNNDNSSEITVDCIDFAKFIIDNFTKEDHIVVKFDIEGAEYPILEKMILDESIKYIKKLYIEWHNRFLVNKYNEEKIISEIKNSGVSIIEWH